MAVYDLAGRQVASLIAQQEYDPGLHALSWSGRHDQGPLLASGVYLCLLQVGDQVRTQRLTLLK